MHAHTALRHYTELLKAGRSAPPVPPTELAAPLAALCARARDEPLRYDAPWRLHPREIAELDAAYPHLAPPGGWAALASLAAGTELLDAEPQGFCAGPKAADAIERRLSERRARVLLIEAMTYALCPPRAAAGWMVLVGLHPRWGLECATLAHAPEALNGSQPARAIARGLYEGLAALLGALRALEPERAYPIAALGRLCADAARFARASIERAAPAVPAPLFLDEILDDRLGEEHARAEEFARVDWIGAALVPSGAAIARGDAFVLAPEAIPGESRVRGFGAIEGCDRFCAMLTGGGRTMAS